MCSLIETSEIIIHGLQLFWPNFHNFPYYILTNWGTNYAHKAWGILVLEKGENKLNLSFYPWNGHITDETLHQNWGLIICSLLICYQFKNKNSQRSLGCKKIETKELCCTLEGFPPVPPISLQFAVAPLTFHHIPWHLKSNNVMPLIIKNLTEFKMIFFYRKFFN